MLTQEKNRQDSVTLEDIIAQLQESLLMDKKGQVHRIIIELVERPLFERILEYTRGNQLEAAKILGVNRNTLRSKIRKLGISASAWKV